MMKNVSTVLLILSFMAFLSSPFMASAKIEDKKEVHVVAEIQKSGVEGEVFSYVVKLLSNTPDIADIRVVSQPQFPADVRVIKGVVRNGRQEVTKYKGKEFYSWTIRRDYIIPSSSGKFSVGKAKYIAFIPHVAGYYDDFWGRHQVVDYEEVAVESNTAEFKVSALPANKSGKEFSGCVGDFNIEGWFPPGEIVAGREAYVVFHISGYGSLQNLKLPNVNEIFKDGCRLKEIDQQENQSQRDGRLFSEVTLTCRFVPESPDFKIAPLCLLFFSPEAGKYVEKCSETLHWTSSPSRDKDKSISKDAISI